MHCYRLETAKLIQGDQLDRQGEQQEGERLSTGYVDELKKKAIKATEKCSKSALVVNTSQKKAKKNKLIFSSNEKIFSNFILCLQMQDIIFFLKIFFFQTEDKIRIK